MVAATQTRSARVAYNPAIRNTRPCMLWLEEQVLPSFWIYRSFYLPPRSLLFIAL